jgi:hypothetical protein
VNQQHLLNHQYLLPGQQEGLNNTTIFLLISSVNYAIIYTPVYVSTICMFFIHAFSLLGTLLVHAPCPCSLLKKAQKNKVEAAKL